jgi:hypothetical protein
MQLCRLYSTVRVSRQGAKPQLVQPVTKVNFEKSIGDIEEEFDLAL